MAAPRRPQALPDWPDRADMAALAEARHGDPFAMLGPHGDHVLALLPEARAALSGDDRTRLDDIAAELAGLFTTQGKADRLADWGLLPD